MTIFGLDVSPLPDRVVAVEAVAIIKCVDEDGGWCLITRKTQGLNSWECLGMLETTAFTQKNLLERSYEDGDDEDAG